MEKLTDNKNQIRTELLELCIGTSVVNTGYNFGQQPNLRDAERIISIEAFSIAQCSLSPAGKTVVSEAVLLKSYLKLVALGNADVTVHTIPMSDLLKQIGGQPAQLIEHKLDCQPIDWEKSTITTVQTTGLTAQDSFLLKVKYLKKPGK